jgi:hypothetical protein
MTELWVIDIIAAWKFCEDHKDSVGWDLTVLNPPYVSFNTIYWHNLETD